ncbi:2-amino-4-hydroxy-6-hydroxymethyldihydropteridine diphosphokinase [Paenibacillus puerhi]|uniref:2-amino-4-hydroxy-6- hydroxymethyldihydropteridine diphosphokinase n=1 Tax=Paenibacillus puerhi TaxID=2692622 RepID=UPI0013572460|nr:2-amino-4-hydroxy-6-hydroxymethyldihydropteridine diphosphokinase [Paenibacillus puerhi]
MNATDAQEREPLILAYIALGSNMGDRERYLSEAIRLLGEDSGIHTASCSGIYETEPVGYTDQDSFLNMVVAVRTSHPPYELLKRMQQVEQRLGRKREVRWGPRTIDLDLLLFGDVRQDDPDLILPHPRMMERAFVLVPLIDAMEKLEVPDARAFRERLEWVEGKEGVRPWRKTC